MNKCIVSPLRRNNFKAQKITKTLKMVAATLAANNRSSTCKYLQNGFMLIDRFKRTKHHCST